MKAYIPSLRLFFFRGLFLLFLLFFVGAIAAQSPFDYRAYSVVLSKYVSDTGLVNYGQLKANLIELDIFIGRLEMLPQSTYDGWSSKEKAAFWINAHNALSLKGICDNYPLEGSIITSFMHGANSVRQISQVWEKNEFRVMGQIVTLENIKTTILPKELNDPRIYLALHLGAIGGGPLRHTPYLATELENTLHDQAKRFVSNPANFKIDRAENKVYLSTIFEWYASEFIKAYGQTDYFANQKPAERAVFNFARNFISADDLNYLLTGKYQIEYVEFDWTLNERK